jgi:hypothetical protein
VCATFQPTEKARRRINCFLKTHNWRYLKMTIRIYCPSLKTNKAHAKNLQRSLGLSLGIAQSIVSHMYGCNNWATLKKQSGKKIDIPNTLLPMHFLKPKEMETFEVLVDKYKTDLNSVYKMGVYQPDDLLSLIVNKKSGAIEHHQIEQILNYYAEGKPTFECLLDSIGWAENGASYVTNHLRLRKNSNRPINFWLNNFKYQQNFYGYYESQGENLHVRVEEWDTALCIPNTEAHIANSSWYVDFMYGYLDLLARQFVVRGYKPTFEIFKIQHTRLSDLGLEHEDCNHPQHGVYKLVRRLLVNSNLLLSGNYNYLTDNEGLKIAY